MRIGDVGRNPVERGPDYGIILGNRVVTSAFFNSSAPFRMVQAPIGVSHEYSSMSGPENLVNVTEDGASGGHVLVLAGFAALLGVFGILGTLSSVFGPTRRSSEHPLVCMSGLRLKVLGLGLLLSSSVHETVGSALMIQGRDKDLGSRVTNRAMRVGGLLSTHCSSSYNSTSSYYPSTLRPFHERFMAEADMSWCKLGSDNMTSEGTSLEVEDEFELNLLPTETAMGSFVRPTSPFYYHCEPPVNLQDDVSTSGAGGLVSKLGTTTKAPSAVSLHEPRLATKVRRTVQTTLLQPL